MAPREARPPVAGTLLAAALAVLFIAFALRWLTQDFEVWTFEDRRRLLAVKGLLRAPTVMGVDQAGTPVELFNDSGSIEHDVLLVDFVYTRCETVCSALGSVFFQLQSEIEKAPKTGHARVGLTSVSFDPLDDAASIRKYAERFGARAETWRVVRIHNDEQRALALKKLGVVAVPDGLGGFVHNGSIHVVGSSGQVFGIYEYERWREALALAQSIGAKR